MWTCNRWHETEVIAWNESGPTVEDTGLVNRDKGSDVIVDILLIRSGTIEFFDGQGKYITDGIIFQISQKELDDTSFQIIGGRTHIEYNGGIYKVMNIKDYSTFVHTQLIECKAMKMIDVD